MSDKWTGKYKCVGKRNNPHPESPEDYLYLFANIDGDGVLMQVIEDWNFCFFGDVVSVVIINDKKEQP